MKIKNKVSQMGNFSQKCCTQPSYTPMGAYSKVVTYLSKMNLRVEIYLKYGGGGGGYWKKEA